MFFFYHKGRVVYDPWHNENGDVNENPAGFYGKDKMEEFCRRIITKKEGSSSNPSSVVVDSKILDFLKMLYFGITDNPFETASRSAYTDMCRTIRFKGKNGDVIRKAVDNLFVGIPTSWWIGVLGCLWLIGVCPLFFSF